MIKKLSVLLVAFLMLCSFSSVFAEEGKITFYVSPNGNDSNDGLTVGTAFATLEGAKSKVQSVLSQNVPVEVIFKEGTYRFSSKIDFTEADSGKSGAEVTYKGAEGERVIFKASKILNTNNFQKVTDVSIKSRLPEKAKENVYMLNLKNEGITYISKYTPSLEHQIEDINFYFNDVEQMPAQWPNGDGNYATFTDIISAGTTGASGTGGTFKYTDSNPDRWTTATDYYIEGFFGNDFRCERVKGGSVDNVNKQLTLATGTDFTIKSTQSKRYKAINLLEELDVPGEWYVDRDKLILYYYPMSDLKNSTLEINNSGITLFNISNASYLNFENIEFTQIRGVTLQALNSNFIDVRNCNFKYVGWGVYFIGNKNGTVDNDGTNHYKNIINGVNNSTIENNTFSYTAKPAVYVTGGNRDTLTSSGNIIKNNYFYKCANVQRSLPMAWIRYGCGDVFENNIMHNAAFHALNYNGNDYKIQNNEIYNANREASDVGMIYTGRSFTERGSVVKNNYLHDGYPKDSRITPSNNAIYFDDTINGQTAEGNIIENVHRGVTSNGMQDNSIINNTFMDCEYAYHANDSFLSENDSLQNGGYATVKDNTYYDKYTNMDSLRSDTHKGKPHYNVITGNTLYNSGSFISNAITSWSLIPKHNTVSDNNTVTAKPTVNLNAIGLLSGTPDGIYSDFNPVFPYNGGYASETVEFMWEDSVGADKYRIVVAKDKEFNEIFKDITVDYNYCTLDGFSENSGEYYWKVYAINTSNQLNNTWECKDVFKFTTIKPKVFTTSATTTLPNRNSLTYFTGPGWATGGGDDTNVHYGVTYGHYDYIHKPTMQTLVDENGILTSKNTSIKYDFSTVLKADYAESGATVTKTDSDYTVNLGNQEFDVVSFIATARTASKSSKADIEGYKVVLNYTDGTTDEKTLTIYGSDKVNDNVILSPAIIYGYNKDVTTEKFNMPEYVLQVADGKTVKSVTFPKNQTPILILAVSAGNNICKKLDVSRNLIKTEYNKKALNCNSVMFTKLGSWVYQSGNNQYNYIHAARWAYVLIEKETMRQFLSPDGTLISQTTGTEYDFSKVMLENNNLSAKITDANEYKIDMNDLSYSSINFVATTRGKIGIEDDWARYDISDYKVNVAYTDGTSEDVSLDIYGFKTVNDSVIASPKTVSAAGKYTYADEMFNMFEYVVPVKADKKVSSFTFKGNQTPISIFAVTGVIKEPNHNKVITSFDISEHCNSVATATSTRFGAESEFDVFSDAYQFDETEILRRVDKNYQIYTDDFIYSLKPMLNEKRAISTNIPFIIETSNESYSKIGFAASSHNESGTISDYPVTLRYTDGTVEEKTVKIGANDDETEGCIDILGDFKARNTADGAIAASARMYSCEVGVDENKLLESVTFGKSGYENNRIFIFAISGIGKDSFELYDFKIKNNSGAYIKNLSGYEGEKVILSFLTKSYNPYQFIFSEYIGNKFSNMDIKNCDGGITKVELEYTVPSDDITDIKGFLWKFDNMKALYDEQILK